ncbi:GNAT family N-acetyltransferase [Flexithrix dorotheae]|uniref:GNAT family N-acetyltransferase n=1 Tax=Flexithrix dorotheae TaxID=70993 RepID=UPI0005C54A6D|nr:N-acetyltransferase [Flexithrix dorotheae]
MFEIIELPKSSTPPIELLLLADPSPALIETYLANGKCFIAQKQELTIGVIVISQESPGLLVIKNIAIDEHFQGMGIGKRLLQFAIDFGKNSGNKKLIICTGNSSINQLALYQKMGFEIEKIRKNFFLDHYPEAIYENGIQCKHQIELAFSFT